jgi:hypothetical protein
MSLAKKQIMKRKTWIFIAIAFLGIMGLGVHIFLPGIAFRMITDYEPITFEAVTNNPGMRAEFGIFDCTSPSDYGFVAEDVDYNSLDGVALNGWYIRAKRSSGRCLVLVHGRTSNRLKTMKYLALADSFDLDNDYNIFIPDLRNSGKSAPSKTLMGYKFGEDVTATLTMLSDRLDQDTLFLYGFSMGAIAICNALGRPDLKEQLAQKGIVIERIIFDSPLANVKETLRDQASDVPLAGLYFDKIFKMYDDQAYGFGENMRMSKLLPNNVPVLILQSKNDHTTKNEFLSMELAEMQDHKKVGVIYFEGPDHVRIFQDNRTRVRYLNAVKDFLAEPR